jgi:60 kDa SS-A/Ro ribonucleoprotein
MYIFNVSDTVMAYTLHKNTKVTDCAPCFRADCHIQSHSVCGDLTKSCMAKSITLNSSLTDSVVIQLSVSNQTMKTPSTVSAANPKEPGARNSSVRSRSDKPFGSVDNTTFGHGLVNRPLNTTTCSTNFETPSTALAANPNEPGARPTKNVSLKSGMRNMRKKKKISFLLRLQPIEEDVNQIMLLRRFCILGTENPTYYAGEKLDLKPINAQAIVCLVDSGQIATAVAEVVALSINGCAPNQDATIFALSLLFQLAKTQHDCRIVLDALETICWSSTDFLAFIANCMRFMPEVCGWKRMMMRAAISTWYNDTSPKALAMALTKSEKRDNWSHQDVLQFAKPSALDCVHDMLFEYGMTGKISYNVINDKLSDTPNVNRVLTFLTAIKEAKTASEDKLVFLIRTQGLVREHIPRTMLNSQAVWSALLGQMSMTSLLDNLVKLTQVGVLAYGNPAVSILISRLYDEMSRERIYPLKLLVALQTYAKGDDKLGKLLIWVPNPEIIAALNHAFYASFRCVVPTGKRFVLALDVSDSMSSKPIRGMHGLTPLDVAAVMAMTTLRTEPACHVMAFRNSFVSLDLLATDSLEQTKKKMSGLPTGATDCSLPMIWARENNIYTDVFVVYTDSEPYEKSVCPAAALQQYREATGIHAKLIVAGMVSNDLAIADPSDSGMLDIVGFDTAAPEIMNDFVCGHIW